MDSTRPNTSLTAQGTVPPTSAGGMHMGTGEPMGAGALIKMSVELNTSFNERACSLDAHADAFLSKRRVANADDATFLRQVLYGVTRYAKMIDALLKSFYYNNASTALRSDVHLYTVFAYLYLLRVDELGFAGFRRLLLSQDAQKMLVLLKYQGDVRNLREWCRDEWLKLYDHEWVDARLNAFAAYEADVESLLATLEERVYLKRKEKESDSDAAFSDTLASTTVPVPFKLHESRVRPPPPEYQPPPPPKPRPVPPRCEGPTREQAAVASERERIHAEVVAKHATFAAPQLATQKRPNNLEAVRKEVELRRAAELEPWGTAKPAPPRPTAAVRLNATAVLREDFLYKRRMEEEAALLRAYEADLRDGAEFDEWRRNALAHDEEARKTMVVERREEAKAAGMRAKQAETKMRDQAANMAAQERREASARAAERQKSEARERDAKAARARQIASEHGKARDAVRQLQQQKRVRADERAAERAANARHVADERAQEAAQREDLIRRLRAMDLVKSSSNARRFDPTITAGHGLLEEMSMAELRAKLDIARARVREEEEGRRAEIRKARQEREEALLAKAANISRIRDFGQSKASARRAEAQRHRTEREQEAAAAHASGMIKLHDRMAKQRAEQDAEARRIADEAKAVAFEQSRLAASKDLVEETNFLELRAGAERAAQHRQAAQKQQEATYEATKARLEAVRGEFLRKERRAKAGAIKAYDAKLRALSEADRLAQIAEAKRKRDLVIAEHLDASRRQAKLDRTAARVYHRTRTLGGTATAAVTAGRLGSAAGT